MATSEDLEQYLGKWVVLTFRGELPNDHMEFTTEVMVRGPGRGLPKYDVSNDPGAPRDRFEGEWWFTPSFRSKFIFELFIEPKRILAIDLADREAR